MKGDVLPDDQTFCDSILDWLTEYVKKPNPFTTFRFYLHYINEEGGKLIIDIIKILKVLPNMTIEWYHHVDDEDLKEYGEELSEELDIPFKYLPISEDLCTTKLSKCHRNNMSEDKMSRDKMSQVKMSLEKNVTYVKCDTDKITLSGNQTNYVCMSRKQLADKRKGQQER